MEAGRAKCSCSSTEGATKEEGIRGKNPEYRRQHTGEQKPRVKCLSLLEALTVSRGLAEWGCAGSHLRASGSCSGLAPCNRIS